MKEKKISLEKIEYVFLKITTHPLFLGGVGVALNATSYRKLIQKRILQSFWGSLELPNRGEQEKALYLLSELEARLARLEKRLKTQQIQRSSKLDEKEGQVRRPFIDESPFQ